MAVSAGIRVDVITIFPDLFGPFLDAAMVGIAREKGAIEVGVHDLRAWTRDRHRTVDDAPYGGGPGMVMKPQPLVEAVESVAGPKEPERGARVVLLSPQGRRLDQRALEDLAQCEHLVLVCGRYEGVDQRAIDLAVDEEVSIGDYVLSGGEIAALALIDACVRLLPGVMGKEASGTEESFSDGLLEYPQYTRPQLFEGAPIPEILTSGDHAKVAAWRRAESEALTAARRPDLWEKAANRGRGQKTPKTKTDG